MFLWDMTVHALRISTISFLRTFIFKLAAVLILPILFGLDGIWWADVTAGIKKAGSQKNDPSCYKWHAH